MRGAPAASRGAAGTTREPAPCRLRPSHLPLSFCACCSIFSVAWRTDSGSALPSPIPRSTWSPFVWTAISVRTRYFSFVSVMMAETAASLSMRSRRPRRREISCRTAGVISTCRPVMSSRIGKWLEKNLPLVRCGDFQLFAVFRDRPPREHQPFLLQDADDLRVAEWLARVFVLDDLPDPLLDRDRRDALAVRAADPAVEEVFQLEHALRRVHVLVIDDPADGGLVHADVVRDVAQYERPEIFDPVIEELPLEVDDARRHLVDRLLTLIDGLDQPQRGSELILHIRARLVVLLDAGRACLVQQPPVDGADAQLRQPFFVQRGDVLIFDLDDVDVGDHVLRLRRVVAAARLRIEVADDFDVFLQILNRPPELARNLGDLTVLQQPQMFGDNLFRRRAFEAAVANLQPEALLQIARGHAHRIERLHVLQRALDIRDRPLPHRGDLFDRGDKIPVVIEVADDRLANLLELFVVGLEGKLPEEVIGKRGRRRERVLDRWQLLHF